MGAPTRPSTLRRVLLAIALFFPAVYVAVAVLRMAYPFELEWLEGLALEHVSRLLNGQPLYVAPSLSFIPFNYTPLYFHAAAFSAGLLGVDFLALRLVSFLASLACFGAIFLIVRLETGKTGAAVLAACLFAATFRLGGAWFDIARPDSLYLLIVLAATCAIRFDPSPWRAPLLAGALYALAFMTKQSGLVVAASVALYCLWVSRTRFFVLAGSMAAFTGGGVLWLDRIHDGWFSYYAFEVAGRHSIDPKLFPAFWTNDVMAPLAIAALVALSYMVIGPPESKPSRRGFYAAVAAGLVGSSWVLRVFPGGYDNVLMTAHAGLAILFGLGWAGIEDRLEPVLHGGRVAASRFVELALVLQFVLLLYNPAAQIPTRADRESGQHLLEILRRLPGEVLVPSHSYLAARAGKPAHFHENAFFDVIVGGTGETEVRLDLALRQAIASQRYSALVLDNQDGLKEVSRPQYQARWRAFDNDSVFWSRTGMRTRPHAILLPVKH